MTLPQIRFILGSGSPRRRELLEQVGIVPDEIRAPDVDESVLTGEKPRDYCRRITKLKAEALVPSEGEVILVADTTVALGRRILGKPADRDEADRFLRLLSGRRHKVITALAVRTPDGTRFRDVVSSVRVKRLSDHDIKGYLATDDWVGKAGGYAIQGPAAAFIPWIDGSHSAIVGLPLADACALLESVGVERRPAK